jgi:hypothetical protein
MTKSVWAFILVLSIALSSWSKDYKGAELRTKEAYVYGRFETSYKPPKGNGMLASFFTYHEIETSVEWNEIDFEILGRYDHDVQVTSIGPGQKTRNSHQYVPYNTHEDYHQYAFEWTPDYIAWFIDGVEYYRQEQDHVQQFVFPQKIMMNIWNPEWAPWSGVWDPRILPLFAFYDYVAYYAYTPGTGNTGTGNNFTLLWKDNFDTWDQTRWEKATHTFGGNNCDFMVENVVFKDGKMILCLTNAAQLGYLDKTPPSVLWARFRSNAVYVHFSEDVDAATAGNESNYGITDVTIQSAQLLADRRTVKLVVSGLDPAKSYSVAAFNIKDRWSTPNRLTGLVQSIHMVQPLTFPVKINVGGGRFADYLPDQLWSPKAEYGHQDGYQGEFGSAIEIANTDEDSLYRVELHELVEYNVRIPSGDYRVTLKMAENNFKKVGERLFDIVVQGKKVTNQLDLIQVAGPNTAYELVVDPVTVSDSLLNIHFNNLWSFSLLNSLVVEQLSSRIESKLDGQAQSFSLQPNYPNPFNAATTIGFNLDRAGRVVMAAYDLLGRQVAEIADGYLDAGEHRLSWQTDLPSGLYLLRLDYAVAEHRQSATRKLMILK